MAGRLRYLDWVRDLESATELGPLLLAGPESYLRDQALRRIKEKVFGTAEWARQGHDRFYGGEGPLAQVTTALASVGLFTATRLITLGEVERCGRAPAVDRRELLDRLSSGLIGSIFVGMSDLSVRELERKNEFTRGLLRVCRVVELAHPTPAEAMRWLLEECRSRGLRLEADRGSVPVVTDRSGSTGVVPGAGEDRTGGGYGRASNPGPSPRAGSARPAGERLGVLRGRGAGSDRGKPPTLVGFEQHRANHAHPMDDAKAASRVRGPWGPVRGPATDGASGLSARAGHQERPDSPGNGWDGDGADDRIGRDGGPPHEHEQATNLEEGFMSKAMATTDTAFQEDVLRSDLPVLVDFWADWCGPCRMLAPTLDQIAAELKDKLKVVKLDVDANPQVASRFGMKGHPYLDPLLRGRAPSPDHGCSEQGRPAAGDRAGSGSAA